MSNAKDLRPDTLEARLAQLERRMRNVEMSQRVGWSGLIVAQVAAQESTTSTTPTDLATVGPSITMNISNATGSVLLMVSAEVQVDTSTTVNNTGNGQANLWVYQDGAVSGLSLFSALDQNLSALPSTFELLGSSSFSAAVIAGLSPGPHTFTAKYFVIQDSQAWFSNRVLIGIPL